MRRPLRGLLDRVRRSPIERGLRRYERFAARVAARAGSAAEESDAALRAASDQLAQQARAGVALDSLAEEAFALAREAARRALGMQPFDVQVIAGLAMHKGRVVQMHTGEGKTLAAVMPVYLNALCGRGVHVLTFNDYLARRDAEWMGPAYRHLGLSVAHVQEGMTAEERRAAYSADVTYATAKEAGFDFLRDHLCRDPDELVQRAFYYAVVDEADSILIDEARVPLVIAGSTEPPALTPRAAAALVRELDAETDFATDRYARDVHFTDAGLDRLEKALACDNLHDERSVAILTALTLALHARVLLQRDVDYIVRDGRVELVDEFTGRVVANRRWPDGLQFAVEAKEQLELQPHGTILGSITLQHFLELYPKTAGMTATAEECASELHEFYGMKVVLVPPNRPVVRADEPDLVFRGKAAKLRALVKEITAVHATGRPILVGTATVRESEELSRELAIANVEHQVLNAKNDAEEARIVAAAGALGAITIATNMAGRGTDIRLGGQREQQRDAVCALGGLYVIGTNRHESRRIDHQLRGRAGRQGDPGSSRFFVSLEDDLMRRYRLDELIGPAHWPVAGHEPIDDPVVHAEIARAQRIIEGETHAIRGTLRRYSSLLEDQRRELHRWRQDILLGRASAGVARARSPGRYRELCDRVGDAVLQRAERDIALAHIDRCWAEHLAHAADIRDGIHLMALGGEPPLQAFHTRIAAAVRDMQQRISDAILETFESVEIGPGGVLGEPAELRGPSATWTYLVTDTPLGGRLDRLVEGIVNRFRRGRS